MIDKEKLKRRFSRNVKYYDQYAMVQKKMGDELVENIKKDNISFHKILEIGCGTGYVTKSLIRHFPDAEITAVDIAPGMIEYAKSNISGDAVEFICGDIEEMILKNQYDLIISNATFQWFNHLDKTMEKLIGFLRPNGILCFSTFGENTFNELHESFNKAKGLLGMNESVSPSQYFYSLNQLKEICSDILTRNGRDDINIHGAETYVYEYFTCCKEFLESVKKIGANNSQSNRNRTNPHFIEKVIEVYDKDYLENDKVRATYHNLFVYMKNINKDDIVF